MIAGFLLVTGNFSMGSKGLIVLDNVISPTLSCMRADFCLGGQSAAAQIGAGELSLRTRAWDGVSAIIFALKSRWVLEVMGHCGGSNWPISASLRAQYSASSA
jgi:hypothetical protein